MMARYSEAYIQHLKQGPFPGRIDPWAEAGRYFHQIHSGMIDHFLGQIGDALLALGYYAGRETSLQIAEYRQPDLHIRRRDATPTPYPTLDYPQAAAVALAEPGVLVEAPEPELDALFIKEMATTDLVTVVEIISPRNKTDTREMQDYSERRERLRHQGTHIVEIDLTRSVKRLVRDLVLQTYSYHVAVHLANQPARFIGLEFGAALKRCALPLRTEVIAVELQDAYVHGYRQTSIATQILKETGYHEDELPFPALLTPAQRQTVVQAAQTWIAELQRLQTEPPPG